MDHPLPVRVVQRRRHAPRDLDRLLDPQLLLAVQLVAQRVALDVRHHVIQERLRLARIVQRQDVRVLQVGGDLDLVQEPLGPDHRGQLGPQHLERDLAVVLHVVGQVDRGHAPGPQLPLDHVAIAQGHLQRFSDTRHSLSRVR